MCKYITYLIFLCLLGTANLRGEEHNIVRQGYSTGANIYCFVYEKVKIKYELFDSVTDKVIKEGNTESDIGIYFFEGVGYYRLTFTYEKTTDLVAVN